MKKTDPSATQTATAAPTASAIVTPHEAAFPVALDEFCQRLSTTDRRVEMISAFHHWARAQGLLKASESEYQARYAEFATHPA